jgi:RNA polymerase sigma-70 factor (ECF subfamily)
MDDKIDLDRCLQRLNPDQRAVLLMVGMQEMSYTSTAQVLGVPVGTVMSRLSRARERLRELMHGQPRQMPAQAQPKSGVSALRRLK